MFPTADLAVKILDDAIGPRGWSASRFQTGASHFVFDAASGDEEPLVVRISSVPQIVIAENAVRLTRLLRPLGVPLPNIVHADFSLSRFPYPFVIMERLPGVDLGDVYLDLSTDQKRRIARAMARLAGIVQSLPAGSGFGFGVDETDASLRPTWLAAIDDLLTRAEGRFARGDAALQEAANQVRAAVFAARESLGEVEPRPFLHDTTTKNVIVHEGRLSGIVDVDNFCFGDQLFTPALTWASLLARGWPTDYIVPHWTDALAVDEPGKRRLRIYTACFCIDLLGEMGQTFGDKDVPVDLAVRARLLDAVSTLLD